MGLVRDLDHITNGEQDNPSVDFGFGLFEGKKVGLIAMFFQIFVLLEVKSGLIPKPNQLLALMIPNSKNRLLN